MEDSAVSEFMPCIFLKTANYLNGSESSLEYWSREREKKKLMG